MQSLYKISYLFLLLLIISSCTDELINKTPTDEASPETLLETEGGFRSALDGVYGVMKQDFLGYNFCILSVPEAINDDVIAGSPLGFTFENTHADIYPLNYDPTEFQLEGLWRICYEAINNANTIIKYGKNSPVKNKDRYIAEALAQRALLHYDLYRFFAPAYNLSKDALAIPYRFEEDALLAKKARNTNTEVIDWIIKDLEAAIEMADNEENSYRLSKTAMQALLARVCLETKQYGKAITNAKEALKDTRYGLDTDKAALTNQWRQDDSDEIIFRIRFDVKDKGSNAAVLAIPSFFSFPYYVADELINLYDQANDIRFDLFFQQDPMSSGSYYPEKHVGVRTADYAKYQPGSIDIKYIRVPELYLILAEANERNQEGIDHTEARNNLNTLRNARGLGNFPGTDGQLLDEIMNERRRELAFEGFRFTDLKRLGLGFTRPDGSGLTANHGRFALPIPKLEIDRSGIEQNEAYK